MASRVICTQQFAKRILPFANYYSQLLFGITLLTIFPARFDSVFFAANKRTIKTSDINYRVRSHPA